MRRWRIPNNLKTKTIRKSMIFTEITQVQLSGTTRERCIGRSMPLCHKSWQIIFSVCNNSLAAIEFSLNIQILKALMMEKMIHKMSTAMSMGTNMVLNLRMSRTEKTRLSQKRSRIRSSKPCRNILKHLALKKSWYLQARTQSTPWHSQLKLQVNGKCWMCSLRRIWK